LLIDAIKETIALRTSAFETVAVPPPKVTVAVIFSTPANAPLTVDVPTYPAKLNQSAGDVTEAAPVARPVNSAVTVLTPDSVEVDVRSAVTLPSTAV
jgi:hypothetical protein